MIDISQQRIQKSVLWFIRLVLWALAILLFIYAYSGNSFRNAGGSLNGSVGLPVSSALSLIFLGWGIIGKRRIFSFWLALALLGHAVALQMIFAGPLLHYQHNQSINQLVSQKPGLLVFLLVQTIAVIAGMLSTWTDIVTWLTKNFKFWQIIAVLVILFISSAALSPSFSRYLSELVFAFYIQILNLLTLFLMARAFPDDYIRRFRVWLNQFSNQSVDGLWQVDKIPLLGALWVFVLASVLTVFVYQRHPHIPDEVMYLFHARYFAEGRLSVPSPPIPEAFSFYLIPFQSQNWYSIFPPGWPAVLSLGERLSIPWLINPLLAGICVFLVYWLVEKLYDSWVARISVILLCLSPWFIFMAMNYMSHTFTLTCALAAVLAVLQAQGTGKPLWGLAAGVAMGVLSLVRPIDAVIMAILLGLYALGVGGKRLNLTALIVFGISTIAVASLILPYNDRITGSSLVVPLQEYYDQYFGPKSNALGFGPERGLGWPIDAFPGHSPFEALLNALLNSFLVNVELFGWSIGSLIFVFLFLIWGKKVKSDLLIIAVLVAILLAYSLYWFSGGPDFGARYWYLMIAPLIVLSVRGIQGIQNTWDNSTIEGSISSFKVLVFVAALCILTVVNFFPWRAIDKYYNYLGMRPDIRDLAQEYEFGKSIIFIQGDPFPDYASAWTYNPLDVSSDAPIYARYQNLNIRSRVLEAFPDRTIWVVEGPTVSGGGFRVINEVNAAGDN